MSQAQLKERGRLIYAQNCMSCHNVDIALDGAVGPSNKGASLELLTAKVLHGKYPEGYSPKRGTSLMPAMPQLERELPALHAYLQ